MAIAQSNAQKVQQEGFTTTTDFFGHRMYMEVENTGPDQLNLTGKFNGVKAPNHLGKHLKTGNDSMKFALAPGKKACGAIKYYFYGAEISWEFSG